MTMTASSAVCSNRSSGLSRGERERIGPAPVFIENIQPLSVRRYQRGEVFGRRAIRDAPAPEVTFRNVVVTVCNMTLAAAERPRNGRVGSKASPALEP